MFCENCGHKVNGDKFCTNCGNTSDQKPQHFSSQSVSQELKKYFSLNKLKTTIIFICIFILSLTIVNSIQDNYYTEDGFFPALAVAVLIVFLWNKLSKRFNL